MILCFKVQSLVLWNWNSGTCKGPYADSWLIEHLPASTAKKVNLSALLLCRAWSAVLGNSKPGRICETERCVHFPCLFPVSGEKMTLTYVLINKYQDGEMPTPLPRVAPRVSLSFLKIYFQIPALQNNSSCFQGARVPFPLIEYIFVASASHCLNL